MMDLMDDGPLHAYNRTDADPYTAVAQRPVTGAAGVTYHAVIACYIAGSYHDNGHARVLCRMRAGDPTVTRSEVRAALKWASTLAAEHAMRRVEAQRASRELP